MKLSLSSATPAAADVDFLALALGEGELERKDGAAQAVDEALGGLLREAAADEDFGGRAEQTLTLHTHGRIAARRVLLAGVGAADAGVDDRLDQLRSAAARAVQAARRAGAKRAALAWSPESPEREVRALAEGAVLGAYRYDRYKSDKKADPLAALALLLAPETAIDAALEASLDLGASTAEAANLARDLVNEPASTMTPKDLAAAARKVAREAGLTAEIAGRAAIEKLKMGMFLGVTRGSDEEPQLIHLAYVPKNAKAKQAPPLALVGKAITFDSGGLDLKTADGMLHMKTDMAGAAAVIGAMKVIAELAPPFPVHAFVGACENMPGARAYKPGDVLVSRAGVTAEVGNTDAEGRLVLGDMLAWACEKKPFAVVDLATLTGACIVGLGPYTIGALSNDDALATEVLAAARAAGEDMWRLPLTPSLGELIKSNVADVKNTGGRYGGAITAGLFLQKFVGKTPWCHLDIAGPSFLDKDRGYNPKGATGAGVRLLVELVRRRATA